MKVDNNSNVEFRNDPYVDKASTKIWQEVPSKNNPYIEDNVYCHGYDLQELIQKRSFIDVLYLLFRSELPSKEEATILEYLMIGLINPGPRHPATWAAMNAGATNTDPAHLLPIALSIYGGEESCASEVEPAMKFLRKHKKNPPHEIVEQLLKENPKPIEGDWHIAPGFGSRYGGIDIMPRKLVTNLLNLGFATPTIQWGHELTSALEHHSLGWLTTGVAAAALTDLGFHPRAATGLFQLFSAPGFLAHAVEMANKPPTAMPFIKDEDYVIEQSR